MEFITQTAADGTTRITVDGNLSIYHAAQIKQHLIDGIRSSDRLELDLSQVGEMDTAGLQLLLLAKLESWNHDHDLHIINHSPAVIEVIEFLNIGAFFGDPLLIPANEQS